MKKHILLVILVVLVLIGGYLAVSQNKKTLSEGDSYTGSKPALESTFTVVVPIGYEKVIDVPETAMNRQYMMSIRKVGGLDEIVDANGVCVRCTFAVEVMRNFIGGKDSGKFQNPEEWLANQQDGNRLTKTTLAGETAYEISSQKDQITYFLFSKHDDLYDLYSVSIKQNDKTANTILSSLKFNF
jgi:hypothetical protein